MRTTTAASAGRARPTAILAIILVSYFMIILDNSIIFTGLPRIQSELNLSATGLSWVQNAYTLVFGGLLLLGARLGDILGRHMYRAPRRTTRKPRVRGRPRHKRSLQTGHTSAAGSQRPHIVLVGGSGNGKHP